MGEEGHMDPNEIPTRAPVQAPTIDVRKASSSTATTEVECVFRDSIDVPMSPRNYHNPFSRTHTTIDMDDYFVGPRDTTKHSKWPVFMRMHGSIMPEMALPLIFVAGWSTLITCISFFIHNLGTSNLLLTVLGFVVGLGLSFRSSTAYERYAEGRKYWAQLTLSAHNLARVIWVHGLEREGEQGKQDLLAKMTGLNLIVAFAVSLKHRLRFEPYSQYEDLAGLVGHLDTYAKAATTPEAVQPRKVGVFKSLGVRFGVSFAESNPRKLMKKANKPLGNLPLEILSYLAAHIDDTISDGLLKIPMQQTLAYNNLASLNDVLTGTERILNTPLPVAYSIAIAQITWVYILILPFQLYKSLGWVTIPGSIIASYIILGILLIGVEIENPFGNDVNDLNIDEFCRQIAADIDIISSMKKPQSQDWVKKNENLVLFPMSASGYQAWASRSERRIRQELKAKTEIGYAARKDLQAGVAEKIGDEKV